MADKKAAPGSQEPETKPLADLLTSILNEVQKQVQSKTPKALDGEALRAVDQFREIVAALALQPRPTITLSANPTRFGVEGGETTFTWSSTGAQRVSIDSGVGEVTPAAGGSIKVSVLGTTTFTATAIGPCSNATASVTVVVDSVR